MPKKQMKFKSGSKVKRYDGLYGSYVDSDGKDSSRLIGEDLPSADVMEGINSDVRRALAGERPPAPEYTEIPSPKTKETGLASAVRKVEKSQGTDPRMLEAMMSRGRPAVDNSVPPASASKYQAPSAESMATSERRRNTATPMLRSIQDYYQSPSSMEGVKRNLSNTAAALTPLTGGASKVATEFAFGNRAAKAATAEKLSPAGQRLANMEEIRNVAMPGRRAAVMNPMAHAGGPKMMEQVAAQEARAIQAEARAAQSAARKTASQAKKDVKDPLMNARPGADKANSGYKYESEEAFPPMYKKGGVVKKFAKGGSVSSASSRADGCAIRGKTKGTISKMKSGGMYGGKGAC